MLKLSNFSLKICEISGFGQWESIIIRVHFIRILLQFTIHDSIHDEPPPVCKWNGHDGNLQWQNKIQNNNVLKTIIFKIEKIKEDN